MRFFIVDCFAERKYQGNELLAIIVDRPVSDAEQQQIAREINFSETVFIVPEAQNDGGYAARIWTPNVGEVPFAGHPTLGAAHVINRFLEGGEGDEIRLDLKAGQIPVRVTESGLMMSQNPPTFGATVSAEEIAGVFGVDVANMAKDYPIQWVSTGLPAVIIPLLDRESLARVKHNREAFADYVRRHPENNCNHLFFVREDDCTIDARCLMEDFVEDPATGSANGCLAAYLLEHDCLDSQDISYTVRQGEDMGRPSILQVHVSRKGGEWTIEVGGSCHVVASGDWE